MDYYDHDYDQRPKRRAGNKKGYFFSGLIGVIVGALLVGLVFPAMGWMNGTNGANEINHTNQSPGIKQNVALNVTSSVTDAYDKAADAVVGITNIQEASIFSQGGEAGTGSGVVYEKANGKAYIVTNHHVIEGASALEVSLSDGTKIPAKVIGSDVWTDLAVIQTDASKIKTIAEFGDSSSLKPGEPVLAIGNPLGLQFSGSVTQGIISGLERTIEIDINQDGVVDWNSEVIQTDTAINPGNSGGALVNLKGQVIGINSMKIAEQAVEGIGLAIPINSAIPVIKDIEKYGEVKRPYLGVSLAPIEEVTQYHRENTFKLPANVTTGVAIVEVQRNSPAAKAGIKAYDVIVEMDGEKIKDLVSFRKHLYIDKKIGDQLKVKFYRNGKLESATITLQGETL
ncbi:S1C family serine protease [Bacillus massiliigorillae]|uniref:S1C family serine protease n=1 Tax=Bacillus massiliigorillae TaxID=1243664 RepID=UPI0003A76F84|nr:S1C family serine protease [Bacillus massiliigorillae]